MRVCPGLHALTRVCPGLHALTRMCPGLHTDQGDEGPSGVLVYRREEHGDAGGAPGPRHPHLGPWPQPIPGEVFRGG